MCKSSLTMPIFQYRYWISSPSTNRKHVSRIYFGPAGIFVNAIFPSYTEWNHCWSYRLKYDPLMKLKVKMRSLDVIPNVTETIYVTDNYFCLRIISSWYRYIIVTIASISLLIVEVKQYVWMITKVSLVEVIKFLTILVLQSIEGLNKIKWSKSFQFDLINSFNHDITILILFQFILYIRVDKADSMDIMTLICYD